MNTLVKLLDFPTHISPQSKSCIILLSCIHTNLFTVAISQLWQSSSSKPYTGKRLLKQNLEIQEIIDQNKKSLTNSSPVSDLVYYSYNRL